MQNVSIPIYETRLVRKGRLRSPPTIRQSQELFKTLSPIFSNLDREQLGVLYLDSGLRPIGFKVESVGGTDKCLADLRLR
jgi:DNA repair protein RadC